MKNIMSTALMLVSITAYGMEEKEKTIQGQLAQFQQAFAPQAQSDLAHKNLALNMLDCSVLDTNDCLDLLERSSKKIDELCGIITELTKNNEMLKRKGTSLLCLAQKYQEQVATLKEANTTLINDNEALKQENELQRIALNVFNRHFPELDEQKEK